MELERTGIYPPTGNSNHSYNPVLLNWSFVPVNFMFSGRHKGKAKGTKSVWLGEVTSCTVLAATPLAKKH